MFAANVPHKLIKERSGHLTDEAMRVYENPTIQQQRAVSAIVCSEKTTYNIKSFVNESAPCQPLGLSFLNNPQNFTINFCINQPKN